MMADLRARSLVAAVVATLLAIGSVAAAGGGSIQGTVTVAGGRSGANVVVSLAASGLAVSPPQAPIEMDQKRLLFIPHVLAVVKGTTVRFLNSDEEDHNVYSPEGGYNLGTWAPGRTREQLFDKPGVYTQLCRIHPDMEAFVVVLDTPYFAVTDAKGRYAIGNVPAGQYTLTTWGKRLKRMERPVTVSDGASVTIDLSLTR